MTAVGISHDYTAKSNILAGQVVALDIANAGAITAAPASASTASWQVLGTALETAGTGKKVSVCRNGFTTVRRVSIATQQPWAAILADGTTQLLNADTNGKLYRANSITFVDSGGVSKNYSSGEDYRIEFDAGKGGVFDITYNTWGFEHTKYTAYDYLTTYDQERDTSTAAFTITRTSSVSVSWMALNASSPQRGGGALLPATPEVAAIIDRDAPMPYTYRSAGRFVRFTFQSDVTTTAAGWNITLRSTNSDFTDTGEIGSVAPAVVGSPLYLNKSDYSYVTETTGGLLIGHVAGTDAKDNAVYCHLRQL